MNQVGCIINFVDDEEDLYDEDTTCYEGRLEIMIVFYR